MYILIVRNNSNPSAIDASLLLGTYLASQDIQCSIIGSDMLAKVSCHEDYASLRENEPDMAIALGGDGTILRTARLLQGLSTPILGINFGHLGFLANKNEGSVLEMVSAALAGELKCERRVNLLIDVVCEGEDDPVELGTEPQRTFSALNEVAITRGSLGRIIDFSFDVSDCHIAHMRGDGLIVATATGSTGYALSAGGPLVAPSYSGLIVAPIAPHTLHSRAILTGENDVVSVQLGTDGANREATLFIDGDLVELEAPVRRVYVRRGSTPTLLLRLDGDTFYHHSSEVFFR